MNCSNARRISDHQPGDKYALAADGEDHSIWGHGFTITAHNRTAGAAPAVVECKYGYRTKRASETGLEAAYLRWMKILGERFTD